jgi:hypothetical protein
MPFSDKMHQKDIHPMPLLITGRIFPADPSAPNSCGQSRSPLPNEEKTLPDGTDALHAAGAKP